MIRAFADASVLYSAIISKTGGSRELFKRHRKGDVQLVVSDYVVEETKRNLAGDHPTLSGSLDIVLDILSIEIVSPSTESIRQAMKYTESKDAPVIAGALDAKCEYLLTFDRQHLIDVPHVAEKSRLKIVTSGDLLHILSSEA